MKSDFCYIDHETGESDHMNAHLRASCPRAALYSIVNANEDWPRGEIVRSPLIIDGRRVV